MLELYISVYPFILYLFAILSHSVPPLCVYVPRVYVPPLRVYVPHLLPHRPYEDSACLWFCVKKANLLGDNANGKYQQIRTVFRGQ